MKSNVMNSTTATGNKITSPYSLENERAYQCWKEWKLKNYPLEASFLKVRIENPFALSETEKSALLERCQKTNSVIYQCNPERFNEKEVVRSLGAEFGLKNLDGNLCADDDGVTSLQVMQGGSRHEGYIPYTDRPINWHTDGYYNELDKSIRGMILHCACDADEGGENEILDPEIVYILMRDENPDFIRAFMQPDVMTIPPNVENGVEIRGAQTGPVFSVQNDTGTLHMRYTARKRNIVWKSDENTQAAVSFLEDLFLNGSDYIYRYRLSPGEGIISNNALHTRTAFRDSPNKKRLIYRARYYDRIAGTNLNEIYRQE